MLHPILVLGIDTCGPSGSVALGRINGNSLVILGQTELVGRSYSATLVSAVGELLVRTGFQIKDAGAIVAVNGPGSFTGVRVGLSAVKGLAQPSSISIVAISRLGVLSAKAGVTSAALDAHRNEIFLRLGGESGEPREMLASAADLPAIEHPPARIAVCDESAAGLLSVEWPSAKVVRVASPTAADALELAVAMILAREFVDLALLDGYYLRRSDAEIFGEAPAKDRQGL